MKKRLFLCLLLLMLMTCVPGYADTRSAGLSEYIREQQLKFVERSYWNHEGECFTEQDLLGLKQDLPKIQQCVLIDPDFTELVLKMKKADQKDRQKEYQAAAKIYTPTWEQNEYIGPDGQTVAGQNAERLIGKMIISLLKERLGKPSSKSVPAANNLQMVWNDEFNTSQKHALDSNKWDYDVGGDGWGNDELEYYTNDEQNVYTENGCMVIKVVKENLHGYHYSSARVVTRGKAAWHSGRIEIRARLPFGKGIWPAIWLLPLRDTYGDYQKNGEIDIMEMVGNDTQTIYGSLHYYKDGDLHSAVNRYYGENIDFSQGFHVYTLEWDKNWMRWYVDDHIIASIKLLKLFADPHYQPFQQDFYLLINVAVGGLWPGSPDGSTSFPQIMQVDYVRIYKLIDQ